MVFWHSRSRMIRPSLDGIHRLKNGKSTIKSQQCRAPHDTVLLQNDALFRSFYSPQNASEVLFWRIEDCQEVQILQNDPYTAQQLLNNAAHLLIQCGLYVRDFEDWDRKLEADKIWITSRRSCKRSTWICAECICCPPWRIRRWRRWRTNGHHTDSSVDYPKSKIDSNYGSRNFSIGGSGDQSAQCCRLAQQTMVDGVENYFSMVV